MARKRANGEGTIIHRKDGRWMTAATIGGERVYFYGQTQRETKEKLDKALEDSRKGLFIKPGKLAFEEWNLFWLNEIAKPEVQPNTYDFYEYLLRIHINPELGHIQLSKLQPDHLLKFYNQKRSEKRLSRKKKEQGQHTNQALSLRTVRGMQVVIQLSLNEAVKKHKIPWNPNSSIDIIKWKNPAVQFMEPNEVIDFLDKISKDRWYSAFLIDLGSGLRAGELAALKRTDYDEDKQTLFIHESVTEIKTYAAEGKKTMLNHQLPKENKTRIVPLPIDANFELQRWLAIQDGEIKQNPNYVNQEYIFAWQDGRIVDPGYLSKHFLKLIREYLPDKKVHLHSLRHSYATMLIERGEDLKVVQENLGHANLATTSGIYAHVLERMKERAARKLDGFTKKEPEKTVKKYHIKSGCCQIVVKRQK